MAFSILYLCIQGEASIFQNCVYLYTRGLRIKNRMSYTSYINRGGPVIPQGDEWLLANHQESLELQENEARVVFSVLIKSLRKLTK